jgi:hypothetical protein
VTAGVVVALLAAIVLDRLREAAAVEPARDP